MKNPLDFFALTLGEALSNLWMNVVLQKQEYGAGFPPVKT